MDLAPVIDIVISHCLTLLNYGNFHRDTILLINHPKFKVENLIKKHEAFEKAAAAQEERFAALERLTTVSVNFIK